jgi:hypothetical protein
MQSKQRRIVFTLDVTEDEAWNIADAVNGIGSYVDGYDPLTVMARVCDIHPNEPRLVVALRTDASALLGDKEMK